MAIRPPLPDTASMRSNRLVAAAAAAAIGTVLAAGCGSPSPHTSLSVSPTAPGALVPTSVTSGQAPAPTTTSSITPPSIEVAQSAAGEQLPISVQSDSQMKAAGNNGPSSSILLPTSCRLTGTTVTAEGAYTNGGFVPNGYNRYGDIIVLYVFTAPAPGYPQGAQAGVSAVSDSPMVGSPAPWHVSLSVSPSVGGPTRCVVAAQPTHDVQLAP